MNCGLCGKERKLIGHHLSYEEEKIISICKICNLMIHQLARLTKDQRYKAFEWILRYSHEWKNGKEKYMASKYRKKTEHIASKNWKLSHPEENKKISRHWKKTHVDRHRELNKRWSGKHPDQVKEMKRLQYERRKILQSGLNLLL